MQTKHNLLFFVLDQVLHVSLLAIVFLTSLKNSRPPLNNNGNVWISLYNSNFACLYFTAIIISCYMGYFVIMLFKKDYLHKESSYGVFEKKYGFVERFVITSSLLLEGLSPLVIPFVLALRPLLFKTMKEKLKLSDQFSTWPEIILSGAYGILTGLLFQLFV